MPSTLLTEAFRVRIPFEQDVEHVHHEVQVQLAEIIKDKTLSWSQVRIENIFRETEYSNGEYKAFTKKIELILDL